MNSLRFNLFCLLMLILSFSTTSSSQTLEPDVSVPEQVMEKVVRRVLVWSFKPRSKPTVIYLAEQGIRKAWLPKIKNIEFRLLSDKEIEQKNLKVYFFTKPDYWRNNYNVGFAFGEPHCVFTGTNWRFSFSKQRVKLWQKYGVGGGCGGGNSL